MKKIFNKIIWIIIFVQLIIICTIVRTSKVDDMTLAKGEETALGKLPFYADYATYISEIRKQDTVFWCYHYAGGSSC